MKNNERVIVAAIRRYAQARGITFQTMSHDWIIQLTTPEGRRHHVFGYDLGLNSSTCHRICNDKTATYQVLSANDIPAIEHRFFLHPRLLHHIDVDGNWPGLIAAFTDFGGDLVVKDNEGTGGEDLYRVRSQSELEARVTALFQICRSVALSPFLPIESEIRFVLLEGKCLLAYEKQRLTVSGDGTRSVRELIGRAAASGRIRSIAEEIDPPDAAMDDIPAAGSVVALQWRHNLGKGAHPVPIDADAPDVRERRDLALAAAATVNLRFGAVDVVMVAGQALALEINSGIMLENAAAIHAEGSALADRVYGQVLDGILG